MQARALRIGVLLGGNLVEERVLTGLAPVTFGQSLRCTLSIPGDGIPHEHVLFRPDQGRLLLCVTRAMTGRLAQRGELTSELHAGPGVDGVWTLPLEPGARGKLVIGDATLLFQELAAPPLAPRPVLPASIRGTLGDRVDRRLAVIIGASLLAHLGIAGYAWLDDLESPSLLGTNVAQQYRQEMMEVTLPEEPVAPVATTDPGPAQPTTGAATPVAAVQTPRPIVARPRPTQAPGSSVDSIGEAQRLASILTGSDPSATGFGDMHARQPGADLGKQIDAVGDRQVVIGDTNHGFREEPGPRLGTDHKPLVGDPTQVSQTTPKGPERDPGGRIHIKPLPPEGPGTTLTVQMVLDKINGVYMVGLQRCYKKGLLGDAQLSGKVAMSFTVTERGGLDDAHAQGVSSEVDACISAAMAGWRFAIPRDKDGDPTDTSFKLALALQPS